MSTYQSLRYRYQPAQTTPTGLTLLLLHGTGGDEHDLLSLGSSIGPGTNVLSVRGNVLEGGMPRFFRRLDRGVFDEADVRFRTHELVHFLREVSRQEGFDLEQVVAIGYSNGANIAGAVLMLYPNLLAGAVLWRPMQPLANPVPAFTTARRQPVLFSAGTRDPTVSPNASDRYAMLLATGGFTVRRADADAGHQLTSQDVTTVSEWFQQHFLTVSSPSRSRS
jgi:phospholipase/carboxylesterase